MLDNFLPIPEDPDAESLPFYPLVLKLVVCAGHQEVRGSLLKRAEACRLHVQERRHGIRSEHLFSRVIRNDVTSVAARVSTKTSITLTPILSV